VKRLRVFVIVAAMVATLCGCTAVAQIEPQVSTAPTTAPISSTAFAEDFVSVQGRSFELGGQPFRFVGANIYDAAASDRYSCRSNSKMSDAQLLQTLQYLHDQAGATVLRFWAYQTYTQGATYWSGMDRVLAAARSVGMKVIPVLEDGPGDCTTSSTTASKADYRGDTWYSSGYKEPYGNATMSYREYVAQVASHYANDPTILGWSMMNEADTSARTPENVPVLVDFATDMASVIRAVDSQHLITVGTQSNGAPGASGADFSAVYRLPQISFAEVHDGGYWGSDTEPMPGGVGSKPPAADSPQCAQLNAKIGCSFARAVALDKPLVVGEAGMKGVTANDRTLRASRLRAKMDAAFAAGASGYLIWSVTTADTDGYDVRISTDDPLIPQMREVASSIR
jgi:mannan endo-1,4-beta-mannosidase